MTIGTRVYHYGNDGAGADFLVTGTIVPTEWENGDEPRDGVVTVVWDEDQTMPEIVDIDELLPVHATR